jgi:hypothetical protein
MQIQYSNFFVWATAFLPLLDLSTGLSMKSCYSLVLLILLFFLLSSKSSPPSFPRFCSITETCRCLKRGQVQDSCKTLWFSPERRRKLSGEELCVSFNLLSAIPTRGLISECPRSTQANEWHYGCSVSSWSSLRVLKRLQECCHAAPNDICRSQNEFSGR